MKRRIVSGVLALLLLGSLLPAKAEAQETMVLYKQNAFSPRSGGDAVFYYDAQGNRVREEWTDAYDYDLASATAENRVVEYTYDNSGVLMTKTVTDEGKLNQTVEYDVHGNEETVWTVDEKGKKVILSEYVNTYDDLDRLTERSWEADSDGTPMRYLETYTYFEPEELGKARVGDEVTLGSFVQSGKEESPLTWIVLDVQGGKALLLSKYGVDSRPYHGKETSVTWQTSDLYEWLNDEFYQQAFGETEKTDILETDGGAEDIPQKLFLLSREEAQTYFSSDKDRICQATDHAVSRNAYVNTATGGSWWWLRDPGGSAREALSVNSDGRIDTRGDRVNGERGVVRPAMWVTLDSLQGDGAESGRIRAYTRQEYNGEDGALKRELSEYYDMQGNPTYTYEMAYDWTNYDYFTNAYDDSGRLTHVKIKRTNEEQRKDKLVSNTWNPYGEVEYTYDEDGHLIRKESNYDTGGLDHFVDIWEYDDQGNMVKWEGNGFGNYTYVPLSKALWKETA